MNKRKDPRPVNHGNGGESNQAKTKLISFLFEGVKAEKSQSQIKHG